MDTDHIHTATCLCHRTPVTRPVGTVPTACPYCILNGCTGETGCTCGYLRELELRAARELEQA